VQSAGTLNCTAWGELANTKQSEERSALAKLIDRLIRYDFAALIRPYQSSFLISKSRVYSPEYGEWLTVDPLLLQAPEKFIKKSFEEMDGFSYAGNDPINYIDPSGHVSMLANYNRRKEINSSLISTGVKTLTSLALGSAYSVAVRRELGLGIGVAELCRNSFEIANLGKLGSLGNFALSIAVKSVGVSLSFRGGQYIGNVAGAVVDTYVDNNHGSFLENFGFGSGDYNSSKESLFDFGVMNPFSRGSDRNSSMESGGNSDNYSMGDFKL
jgi:RHS repeat-associated protein